MRNSNTAGLSSPARSRIDFRWPCIGLVALVAVLVRLVYVQLFSSPLAFWDQWDAEAAHLLKPWIEGHFGVEHLFHAHNEHRILPTKLLTISIYEITGRWSNMDQARFAAILYGAIPAMLIWAATKDASIRYRGALAALALLFAVLPFSWENVLVGFQSQFYFMLTASIAALILAARYHDSPAAAAGVFALSVFACTSMASGLIAPLVAVCVYVLAIVFLPGRRWPALVTSAILLVLALVAYLTIPQLPAHQTLRPETPLAFLDAVNHMLSWPVSSYHLAMLALWAPAPIVLAARARGRRITRTDVVMAGLYGWSVAQVLAIAAGRGQGMIDMHPRYTELLIPGFFANAWFALSLFTDRSLLPTRGRLFAIAIPAVFLIVLVGGLIVRTPVDFHELRMRSHQMTAQRTNTLHYLHTNDPAVFDKPLGAPPYPDHARLKVLLDTPAIRQALHWADPLPPPATNETDEMQTEAPPG